MLATKQTADYTKEGQAYQALAAQVNKPRNEKTCLGVSVAVLIVRMYQDQFKYTWSDALVRMSDRYCIPDLDLVIEAVSRPVTRKVFK